MHGKRSVSQLQVDIPSTWAREGMEYRNVRYPRLTKWLLSQQPAIRPPRSYTADSALPVPNSPKPIPISCSHMPHASYSHIHYIPSTSCSRSLNLIVPRHGLLIRRRHLLTRAASLGCLRRLWDNTLLLSWELRVRSVVVHGSIAPLR